MSESVLPMLDAWDKCSGLVHWEDPEGWGERREGGSGWGTHVNPWLIHVSVRQKPLQYCKVISLQLIKINGKKKKEMLQMNSFIYKTENRLREKTYGCQGEGLREGIVREFGMDMYTLLYIKRITNRDTVHSTEYSAQCYVAAWMGGGCGENEYVDMYG